MEDLNRPASPPNPLGGWAGWAEAKPATAATGLPIRVNGERGWRLPGVMPKGEGPTVKVLVVDPKNNSRMVERRQIEPDTWDDHQQEAA